jgi:molybdopterin-guanine dinucleotide biosynthesis protein A
MSPPAARARCTGVILAGGANTRFHGRAKGLELVGDRTIVERVADALRTATDDLLLVANAADALGWLSGVRVASDLRRERGSLVGVHTALARTGTNVLIVAWDMPWVSSELLAALREDGEAHACAAVPESAHGVEPLCAYYPAAALSVADRLLDDGEMRLSMFVDALPCVRRFDAQRLASFGDPSRMFFNVNDDESLARARAMARESASWRP